MKRKSHEISFTESRFKVAKYTFMNVLNTLSHEVLVDNLVTTIEMFNASFLSVNEQISSWRTEDKHVLTQSGNLYPSLCISYMWSEYDLYANIDGLVHIYSITQPNRLTYILGVIHNSGTFDCICIFKLNDIQLIIVSLYCKTFISLFTKFTSQFQYLL